MNNNKILSLYAVRNKKGQYFKNIGYGGHGKSWVDSLDKARIYTKIGQARSRVTWWAENFPDYGAPELIELVIEKINVVDDSENILKNKKKKIQNAIRSTKRMIEYTEKQKFKERYPYEQELKDLENKLELLDKEKQDNHLTKQSKSEKI